MNQRSIAEPNALPQIQKQGTPFAEVLSRRISRRAWLKEAGALATIVLTAGATKTSASSSLTHSKMDNGPHFEPIGPDASDNLLVAPGHEVAVLIRWGDPITANAPEFDPEHQTGSTQARQFGYNCDFVGFLPIRSDAEGRPQSGFLVVNHEYTNPELMFPAYDPAEPTRDQVEVEWAAHGISVVEIRQVADGSWTLARDSGYNRRFTAQTPMLLTGPAAGADLLKTAADPTGTQVLGTLNNCSGGKTPWGTVLSGEENFHQYFAHLDENENENSFVAQAHRRYGLFRGPSDRKWERFDSRFDLREEPNEPFRFGWVVEIDPSDPTSTPRKRTALGRFRHEAATVAIAPDRRIAVYSGDDERFEYIYKFLSKGQYDPEARSKNGDLLDEGTLYVARFEDDGSGHWLPLVQGQGALTEANGFASQADVLIHTRQAADVLGATPMDRPEDIEPNPINGKVYIALTNNTSREPEGSKGTDAANPRPQNRHGHVIELLEDGEDPTATSFRWEILLLCGEPDDPSTYFSGFPKDQVSSISCPDNVTFDTAGHLWIATDGQPKTLKINDGLYAVPVEGPARGQVRQFLSAVPGSEVCGPEFTPDDRSLFVAIQHPGEGGTFAHPASRWPDQESPPRPSVIAVRANDGQPIGSARPRG